MMPVPISSAVATMRSRGLPSAAMNTNSTPPGTSASPLASARKANASAMDTVTITAKPASVAHPVP